MRIVNIPLISVLNSHGVDYPTPSNFNYFFGLGSTAGAICLVGQLITGILLAMHYTPHIEWAFNSIEHITRDVNNGWLIKYIHANGASMFFAVTYIHMGRGIYFKSYRKSILWYTGFIIYVLMMGTAFMGYILPWGQMSYWAATVITNLASSIPFCGEAIVKWLWGGFSVDLATLQRFFSLHYLLPFLIVGLVIAHLSVLHTNGSTNPLGISSSLDKISFYPYFLIKDLLGWFVIVLVFGCFVFFGPNLLGHPDNYIRADALVTPAHIVPEWYFLPFYAVLRSIPDKIAGIICFALAIVVLLLLPSLPKTKIKVCKFDSMAQFFFWVFVSDVILLTWIGAQALEHPYILLGQIATIVYFSYFLLVLPFLSYFEFYVLKKKDS